MEQPKSQAELEARVAELEAKLASMEASRRASDPMNVMPQLKKLVPEDVWSHMRNAQKEQLMAIRSLLDHWIERGDKDPMSTRRESISIE